VASDFSAYAIICSRPWAPNRFVTPSTASSIAGSTSSDTLCSGGWGVSAGASIESELLMSDIQTQQARCPGERSALDVGELLADLPVPEPQHVGASDVPRGPVVVHPLEPPAQHPAVAGDERLLLGERGLAGAPE